VRTSTLSVVVHRDRSFAGEVDSMSVSSSVRNVVVSLKEKEKPMKSEGRVSDASEVDFREPPPDVFTFHSPVQP